VNDITGKNLDWFWNRWFFANGYIDLAISGVKKSGGSYAVALDNVGGYPVPVDLIVTYADGSTQSVHATSAIWERDGRKATVSVPGAKAVKSVAFSGGIWVDADPMNNAWPSR
jgi:hypothetical protein